MDKNNKTKRKINKSKPLPNKTKEKDITALYQSSVLIIVALIGFLGIVLVPFIEKDRMKNPEKPLILPFQVTNEYFLEMSQIELSSDAILTDRRFFKAPKIGAVATCSNCLEDDALCVRIGKPRLHESALPMVPRDNLKVKSEYGGRRLITLLDSKPFIRKQYKSTPHGLYRVEFEVFDPCKPDRVTSMIEFNYVYKEDFIEPYKVLTFNNRDYGNIAGINGGLEMRKLGKTGRFVSANLKQKFDFKTDFCISGFFTLEFENAFEPSGFDIALCDKWGEKLSVVFADGHLRNFSIKMIDENRGSNQVLVMSNKTKIGRTTKGKTVNNYFKIFIWQHGGQNRCSLYVQSGTTDFRRMPCVHERVIDTSIFAGQYIQIRFKLWKAGVLKLYNFEVKEMTRQ